MYVYCIFAVKTFLAYIFYLIVMQPLPVSDENGEIVRQTFFFKYIKKFKAIPATVQPGNQKSGS